MEPYLQEIGEFGYYQKKNFLLLSMPTIVVAMQKFAWVFLGAKVNHRCLLPWENENATYSLAHELMNAYYPVDEISGMFSQCQMYRNISQDAVSGPDDSTVVHCTKHVYDLSEYQTSAVIDYELVCDRAWMRATVQSLFMIGMLVGSYLFGDLSDRFGRKPVFLSAIALMTVVGVGQASFVNYYFFIATRFILGASLQGIFLIAYVIMMEMVGKGKRVVVGIWAHGFYSIAYFTGAALAYSISSWRWLQVAFTVPAVLFIPYYWIIPESPRWLSTKGRGEEARKILEKAAEVNSKKVTEEMLTEAITPPKGCNKGNIIDLFRHKSLRLKTIVVSFIWMVNSGVYYGLSLNTSNLGGNDYFNFMISGAVEIPALTLAVVVLQKIGRRIPLCSLMVMAGLALVATIFIPKEHYIWLTTLAMFGKMCISASYAIIYTFTAEIFPTVVRNVAVGSSSMVARIGGALSPYVNLLGDYWPPLPLLIFGGLSLLAGFSGLLLPETKGKPMEDIIEETLLVNKAENGFQHAPITVLRNAEAHL